MTVGGRLTMYGQRAYAGELGTPGCPRSRLGGTHKGRLPGHRVLVYFLQRLLSNPLQQSLSFLSCFFLG
jgi:hypothetical protein